MLAKVENAFHAQQPIKTLSSTAIWHPLEDGAQSDHLAHPPLKLACPGRGAEED